MLSGGDFFNSLCFLAVDGIFHCSFCALASKGTKDLCEQPQFVPGLYLIEIEAFLVCSLYSIGLFKNTRETRGKFFKCILPSQLQQTDISPYARSGLSIVYRPLFFITLSRLSLHVLVKSNSTAADLLTVRSTFNPVISWFHLQSD